MRVDSTFCKLWQGRALLQFQTVARAGMNAISFAGNRVGGGFDANLWNPLHPPQSKARNWTRFENAVNFQVLKERGLQALGHIFLTVRGRPDHEHRFSKTQGGSRVCGHKHGATNRVAAAS